MAERPRKAVIPAAGLGTRFLPATKSQPKEMLPVVDKPAIQYVVEEAVRAGLTDVLVVTGRGKRAIEDHFDRSVELEVYLDGSDRTELLAELQGVAEMATIHSVRQRDPIGLGHAVSMARDHVASEPFAVLLGDDLLVDESRNLSGMVEAYERTGASILALLEVTPDVIGAYGCATVDAPERGPGEEGLLRVRSVVEKPDPAEAPSNLAVIGRYVFAPEIFAALDDIGPGRGGEIQLTDAIGVLAERQPVYGIVLDATTRFDVGTPLGWLRANLELALQRPELEVAVRALLAELHDRA